MVKFEVSRRTLIGYLRRITVMLDMTVVGVAVVAVLNVGKIADESAWISVLLFVVGCIASALADNLEKED